MDRLPCSKLATQPLLALEPRHLFIFSCISLLFLYVFVTKAWGTEHLLPAPHETDPPQFEQPRKETHRLPPAMLPFAITLPKNLTPQQKEIAHNIISQAKPRLIEIHSRLNQTLQELHMLSFASDTPPDALSTIGQRLIALRNEMLHELRIVSRQLEKDAGFNPRWGTRRTCTPHRLTPPPSF